MTDQRDEQWLRDVLAAGVPDAPAAPDRKASAHERHRRTVRRTASLTVAAAVLTVVALTLPIALTRSADRAVLPVAPSPTQTRTGALAPDLACGHSAHRAGGGALAPGAVAIRLCGGGGWDAPAPNDVLTTGLDRVLASLDGLPAPTMGCLGGMGVTYPMLIGYADGSVRRVVLDMSGCGTVRIGAQTWGDPDKPYRAFLAAVREQRRTATPPTAVARPRCLQMNSDNGIADPADMAAALLCVSYGDMGATMSVPVPGEDLRTVLRAWRADPTTPSQKGMPCGPTTPTWVLSGLTAWGDPVQITAECGVPTRDQDDVHLDPAAQGIVDRLVAEIGYAPAKTPTPRDVAWQAAQAYVDDVNYGHRDAAAALWAGHPQLPAPGTVLDLTLSGEGCHSLTLDSWRYAWSCPYRSTGTGATTTFTLVRNEKAEIWRIWSAW